MYCLKIEELVQNKCHMLAYVPARFKKVRILLNIIQCLLSSCKNLSPLAVHRTETAILVKKNEYKAGLIPLKDIFRLDTWKIFI